MDFIDEIIWPSSTDDASIATTDDVTLATEQTTSILVTWSTTKVPEGDDGLSTGKLHTVYNVKNKRLYFWYSDALLQTHENNVNAVFNLEDTNASRGGST